MSDTIAAVATGGGISAIGIVRVSGPDAINAADAVFTARGGVKMLGAETRRLYYGELHGVTGAVIDICMCTISRAPKSYTGEDTAEFFCHGSPAALSEALRALFMHGVRQALPGEFTKRAFLNGRVDLTQAEAVIDVIEAETASALHNAVGQLGGAVRERIDGVYGTLVNIMSHFHAVIDYPDEDIDDFALEGYLGALGDADGALSLLLGTFERGQVLKDGVPAAIIGRPNVGKSSLLNALLGYDRAIVTDIAGTTRDTLEEKARVGGVLLRVIDTAGIRRTADQIERLGVERSLRALDSAALAIMVFDGSLALADEDLLILRSIPDGVKKIAVINKSDLPQMLDTVGLEQSGAEICRVCAVTGDGLDGLEGAVSRLFAEHTVPVSGEVITNARQADAILRAREAVREAREAARLRVTPDAVLTVLEGALMALGEITGASVREDVTTRIFGRFCVGK